MTGNMYKGKTTWNPLAGKCKHECVYCSTHTLRTTYPACEKKYGGVYRIIEKEMKKSLGKGKEIFVCAQNDLFAKNVPDNYIHSIIANTHLYASNIYLFQSKNPYRMGEFLDEYPQKDCWLGTTIETNRNTTLSIAPKISERAFSIRAIKEGLSLYDNEIKTFVTIEPIVDFDIDIFVEMLFDTHCDKIYIGADSKNHNLPEPPKDKIQKLITELKAFVEVEIKDNLQRLVTARMT